MEKENCGLYLFEALELRGEYDARIETIKSCLNKNEHSKRGLFLGGRDSKKRPSPDFNLAEEAANLRKQEFKRRKLNSAIQKANYETTIEFGGQDMNLLEALDVRKAMNTQLTELNSQVVDSAYQNVIYKEDRDIIEQSEVPYTESKIALDECRCSFRELNRKLRLASFRTKVDFQDE